MPTYLFQNRFVFPILIGAKMHTIRRRKKNLIGPGDPIQMFVNWRTKNVCMFAAAPCVKVEPIILYPWTHELLVANEQGVYCWMHWEEVNELARRDGFESDVEFFNFFRRYKSKMLDDFEIIHWDSTRVEIVPGVRMMRASDLTPDPFPAREGEKKLEAIIDWEERRKHGRE